MTRLIWLVLGGTFGLLLTAGAVAHADALSDYDAGVAAHDRGDVIAAIELLQRAADQGHVPAMARLAYLLDKAEQNEAAFRMYSRAADAGNVEAALALGVMLANGEGVQKDNEKALAWMTRSAKAGHGPAIMTLAQLYLLGELGVAQDRDQALRWLEEGVKAGYAPAKRELDRLRSVSTHPGKK